MMNFTRCLYFGKQTASRFIISKNIQWIFTAMKSALTCFYLTVMFIGLTNFKLNFTTLHLHIKSLIGSNNFCLFFIAHLNIPSVVTLPNFITELYYRTILLSSISGTFPLERADFLILYFIIRQLQAMPLAHILPAH